MFKRLIFFFILAAFCACAPSEEELLKAGIDKIEAGDYQKAISFMDQLLAKNEKHLTANNIKGVALFQLGKIEDAISAFTIAISIDSASYKPYLNRGNAYMEKKLYKEALVDYNRANGLDASQKDIYYNRGLALLGLESYEDAVIDLQQALSKESPQALVFFNLGKAYLGNNEPVQAIEALIQSVNLDQSNPSAYYLLGVTQMSALGLKQEGCANLKMALSLGSKEAQTWVDDYCKD